MQLLTVVFCVSVFLLLSGALSTSPVPERSACARARRHLASGAVELIRESVPCPRGLAREEKMRVLAQLASGGK